MKKILFFILPFTLFVSSCGKTTTQSVIKDFNSHYISAYELQQKIRDHENILIIDIRRPSQYQNGHIPHSINVPDYELKPYVRDHNVQTVTMILVAQYQIEAKQSMTELIHMGYKDIMVLTGGIRAWEGEIEQ